jgi:dolichyl-phosphate-mannose--protein O-mannosyl transferase
MNIITCTKYKNLWIIIAVILIMMIYGYNLHFPPKPYFDEEHYVKFSRELINDFTYNQYANQHPPLFHVLTAACMKIFGDAPYSWRIISYLSGMGVLIFIYLLTKKITKDPLVAAFAVFFSVFDCLSFTQARISMMNSLMLFFVLITLWNFLNAFPEGKTVNKKSLLAAALFWGLAISTKMITLNLILFFVIVAFFELSKRTFHLKSILLSLLYFCVIPVAIFISVHLFIPFLKDRTLADIWNIFIFNMQYHAGMRDGHPYASRWWSWPLMLRPIWFYFEANNWNTPQATMRGILCIGNPVIFWMMPFAIGNLVWEFFEKHSKTCGLILLGFCMQWLPFALGKRMQMFHYFYIAMPFVVMAFAVLAAKLWRANRMGKTIVVIYALCVIAMFIYWYPLLTSISISSHAYMHHMWFRVWI